MPYQEMERCCICPRECGINRYQNTGFCGAGAEAEINLATLHHGEEPPISGTRGSGTIFFSHCNLRCVFCQNYQISSLGWGRAVSSSALADLMLELQAKGAHNINLVTPTHFSTQIGDALQQAKTRGLSLPVVWNSSAYEKVETLRNMQGLVDIWLPDYKYAHGIYARKYSQAVDYPQVAKAALQEMFAQSGHLQTDAQGLAQRGMLVRLLVLPHRLAGTMESLRMLAETFSTELNLSLMAQYYPAGKAGEYPELNRGLSAEEYAEAIAWVQDMGFENVWVQELKPTPQWTPEFRPAADRTDSLEISVHHPEMEPSK